jgi:hypothetical protein
LKSHAAEGLTSVGQGAIFVAAFSGLHGFHSSLLWQCRVSLFAVCALAAVLPASGTAFAACAPPAVDAANPAAGTTRNLLRRHDEPERH